MTQNRSSAVMAQRAEQRRDKNAGIWTRDPHDWYVEPHWASRRLFEEEVFVGSVTDPACGCGRIVESAIHFGKIGVGYDIVKRNQHWSGDSDNFVSNPPFGLSNQFAKFAIERAHGKVALLLPATWHFGKARSAWLKTTPLSAVLALTPRPSMPPGAVIAAGEKPGGGTKDFSWYIWDKNHSGPWRGGWLERDSIPPCRKRLERADDYPVALSGDGRAD